MRTWVILWGVAVYCWPLVADAAEVSLVELQAASAANEVELRPWGARREVLEGDFDGDGRGDRGIWVEQICSEVAEVSEGLDEEERSAPCKQGLLFVMGDGGYVLLGAGVEGVWGERDEPAGEVNWGAVPEDMDLWVASKMVPLVGGSYEVRVLFDSYAFELAGAKGDGLYLSSTDSAMMLYLTEKGWVLYSLGF